MEVDSKSKYFNVEESKETLTKNIYNARKPLVTRNYTYKSGATYSGQWRGGLRHGAGVMTWPDGAKYDGMWVLN